jgi:hypothetical protein
MTQYKLNRNRFSGFTIPEAAEQNRDLLLLLGRRLALLKMHSQKLPIKRNKAGVIMTTAKSRYERQTGEQMNDSHFDESKSLRCVP